MDIEGTKVGDLIFVYGTLKRGEKADMSRHNSVAFVSEGKANGLLYDLGWYPGVLRVSGSEADFFDPELPVVHGDVFKVVDTSIMAVLDVYEGHPTLFKRTMLPTNLGLAWIYLYNNAVGDRPVIQSGVFEDREVSSWT